MSMHTLDASGDTKVLWDRDNDDEVSSARRTFNELLGKGYLAYKAEGKRGEKGEQIREFDRTAERIILVKPSQGG